MVIRKILLLKSLAASGIITLLLFLMIYIPLRSLLSEIEQSKIVIYLIPSILLIFCILTAILYFDIRKVLERKSY